MATEVFPPFGLLSFSQPTDAGQTQFYINPGSFYSVETDGDFPSGVKHYFDVATAGWRYERLNWCDSTTPKYISLGDGYQIRFHVQHKLDRAGTAESDAFLLFGTNGYSFGYRHRLSSAKNQVKLFVVDGNGTRTYQDNWYDVSGSGTADYGRVEGRLKRYISGGDTKLEFELRLAIGTGALASKETKTITISGADKAMRFEWLRQGHEADASKGAAFMFGFGLTTVAWDNGTIEQGQEDRGFFSDWNPTISSRQVPDADVTSPDEWFGVDAGADLTNLHANIDDGATDDGFGSSGSGTTKQEFLVSWPAAPAVTTTTVVRVCMAWQDSYGSTSKQSDQVQPIAKESGTYLRLEDNAHAGPVGNAFGISNAIWHTPPASAAWTQSVIDNTDFGWDKPVTASTKQAWVGSAWRFILYGGVPVAVTPRHRTAHVSAAGAAIL